MSEILCPQCGTEVDHQIGFGMITCPHCQHLFMAEDSENHQPVGEPPESVLPGEDLPVIDFKRPSRESLDPDVLVTPSVPDGETFQDVVEFGNKEVSASGAGGLFYDVEISGIDTPELRQELKTIIEDKRLNLPASVVLPKIKDGTLKLSQMHPVRAAVLVGRLKSTGLKVRWITDQLIKTLVIVMFLFSLGAVRVWAGDWDHHESSLKGYAIKINNLQDDIHDLAMKKKDEPDPKKREDLLVEIKKKYAELTTTHKEMLKEIEHVRYEHPEKGEKTERRYRHIKVKTLEELENDNSLDGQLSKVKRKAEDRYQRP